MNQETTINETNCCPKFNPEPWDKHTFNWENKKFIKAKVFTLFFMPINFGSVITKLMKQVEAAGGKATDYLCLSDHTSKWSMDIYLAVDKEIAGAENVNLTGKYISKVYEGNFKDTGIWCKDFEQYVKDQNQTLKKMYMWYTTCPKCAKHYGKNYTVLVAEV